MKEVALSRICFEPRGVQPKKSSILLKVVTPEQMQAADRTTIESGVPSFELMKAAGREVGRAAADLMGGAYGRRVTVLAGTGNNGGDGLIAARYLYGRGSAVKVLFAGDPNALKADAGSARRLFLDTCGEQATALLSKVSLERQLARSDLVIDAIVGTGFRGALEGPAAEAASLLNRSQVKVLAVDIPSGVSGVTGAVEGEAIRARRTVALAALKPGLLLYPGSEFAGDVLVAEIGIPEENVNASMFLAEAADAGHCLPSRPVNAHKRSVGKILIVAGSRGMSGAAVLAAQGAFRAGAGLVWVAAPRSVAPIIEQSATEVVVASLPETDTGGISPDAAEQVLERADQSEALAVGPGLGKDPETRELIFEVMNSVDKPVVLDADGINAYQGRAADLKKRTAPTVLSPHAGELSRLLDQDVKHIQTLQAQSAKAAAEMTGATVLLKGSPTIVAGRDRTVVVNTGGPFLASAGTGDVLTGVLTALASQMDPEDAAWAAAWLHGKAGRLAAAKLGAASVPLDRGLIASDLFEMLPAAVLQARTAV